MESDATHFTDALNASVEQADGLFVARMDADDWSYPRRLERQLEFLTRPQGTDVVSCRVEAAHAQLTAYVDWSNKLRDKKIPLRRFVESPVVHPSVMWRRKVAERYGAYRTGDFPEDYGLWLRRLDAGVRTAKLPEVLLGRRTQWPRYTRNRRSNSGNLTRLGSTRPR